MNRILLFLSLWVSIVIVSCSDDNPTQPVKKLTIAKFTPNSGGIDTEVKIYCVNFPANVSAPEITFFGGAVAVLNEITNKQDTTILSCVVPANAVTGKITIKADAETAVSQNAFTVIENPGDLFPTSQFSYWVYKTHELDQNNEPIYDYFNQDSIVISGAKPLLGKTATIFKNYLYNNSNSAYEEKGEQYYHTYNSRIYAHTDALNSLIKVDIAGFQLPFQLEEQWLLLADPYQSSWQIYKKDFDNDSIQYGVIWVHFTGKLQIDGSFIADESLNTSIGALFAKKYLTKLSFAGFIKIAGQDIPVNISRELYSWYSPSIGRVKIKMATMFVNVPELLPEPQVLKGYDTNLLHFKITQ